MIPGDKYLEACSQARSSDVQFQYGHTHDGMRSAPHTDSHHQPSFQHHETITWIHLPLFPCTSVHFIQCERELAYQNSYLCAQLEQRQRTSDTITRPYIRSMPHHEYDSYNVANIPWLSQRWRMNFSGTCEKYLGSLWTMPAMLIYSTDVDG
jgi:hypothetical protein